MSFNIPPPLHFSVRLSLTEEDETQQYGCRVPEKLMITEREASEKNCP